MRERLAKDQKNENYKQQIRENTIELIRSVTHYMEIER